MGYINTNPFWNQIWHTTSYYNLGISIKDITPPIHSYILETSFSDPEAMAMDLERRLNNL